MTPPAAGSSDAPGELMTPPAASAAPGGGGRPGRGRDAGAVRKSGARWPRGTSGGTSGGVWTAGAAGLVAAVLAAGLVSVLVGTVVTNPAVIPGISPGPIPRYGVPVARLLLDLAAAAVVGLALLSKLLGFDDPQRTEPVLAAPRRWAVHASAIWAVTAIGSILLLAAELAPGRWLTPSAVWRYVLAVPAGKGLALSAGCAVLSWWLARLAVRHGERVPAELRVGVGLFGLLPLPLTGHAADWYYHDLSMVTMELHVTGSTLWAGGLAAVVIVLARHRDLLARALPKFSKLATWCVFVVGLTGVANGLVELALSPITELPGSLWQTRYGVLLLAKTVCLAAIAVIAIRVRGWILPMVAAGRRTSFALWCGAEISVLSVAFAVAVVLTRAQVTPF